MFDLAIHDDPLADDLLEGGTAIALYLYGDPKKRRKVYAKAEKGLLPGVYKSGGELIGLKSQMRAGLIAKASGKAA